MKLHLLSDLHCEMEEYQPADVQADMVILAGDIHSGAKAVGWAKSHYPQLPVILVPGNHEFYGSSIQATLRTMRASAAGTNIRVLDNESTVIQGIRFLGATLWTDFELLGRNPALAMRQARDSMSDYRVIRTEPDHQRLSPQETAAMHRHSRAWLAAELAKPHDGPTVVISHHAPAIVSCDPRFHNDPLCPAFASNLEELVKSNAIALWVNGHTHFNHNYQIGGTRIISNQYGYPHENLPGFDPAMVVTL